MSKNKENLSVTMIANGEVTLEYCAVYKDPVVLLMIGSL